MPDDVKPRRAYRSTKRAERVAQTRRDIVAAAGAMFREHGYGSVSMETIADTSGVAVETIYRAFGSKAGLFRAVVDAAVAGGESRAQVRVLERPVIRAINDEADPRRQVEMYAATQPGIHRRAGGLLRVLAQAAPTDRVLASLWESIESDRRHGQAGFVAMLAARGALRPGCMVEEGRDVVWTLTSLAVFDMLVGTCGWSADQYERWLATSLQEALLPRQTGSGPQNR